MQDVSSLFQLLRDGFKAHSNKGQQHSQITDAVQNETDPFTDRGYQKTGNGRADKPGSVNRDTMSRDYMYLILLLFF